MAPTRFAGLKTINASGVTVIDPTSPVLMDGAITIGEVNVPLNNGYLLTNAAVVENAAGDVSINVAAAQNAVIGFAVSEYMKQINALLSTTSVPAINNSGLLADGSGDSPIAKGCKITNIVLAYSIQAGPLTSFTARLDTNTQSNGVVNVITNAIAVGQNGLSLANTANATTCTVTTIPVAAPLFDIALMSATYLRLNPVTPAGCTFRLYGVSLIVTFNLN